MTERVTLQREVVKRCAESVPAAIAPLWETIAHAPDVVLPDVLDGLQAGLPDARLRLEATLVWLGHEGSDCPVCWMLVGRLPYAVPELGRRLPEVLHEEAPDALWIGATRFLATRLAPRHALPAGLSRDELSLLLAEVRAWESSLKDSLRARAARLLPELAVELERQLG